jgi:hypothetical protein
VQGVERAQPALQVLRELRGGQLHAGSLAGSRIRTAERKSRKRKNKSREKPRFNESSFAAFAPLWRLLR